MHNCTAAATPMNKYENVQLKDGTCAADAS